MTIGDVIFYCLVETVKKQNTFTVLVSIALDNGQKYQNERLTEPIKYYRAQSRYSYAIILHYLHNPKTYYQY